VTIGSRGKSESDARKSCSVERILAFTNEYEAEKPAVISHKRPPQDWPRRGEIQLDNLVIKYRPDLPPVLKGISLTIKGGEKVSLIIAVSLLRTPPPPSDPHAGGTKPIYYSLRWKNEHKVVKSCVQVHGGA